MVWFDELMKKNKPPSQRETANIYREFELLDILLDALDLKH